MALAPKKDLAEIGGKRNRRPSGQEGCKKVNKTKVAKEKTVVVGTGLGKTDAH